MKTFLKKQSIRVANYFLKNSVITESMANNLAISQLNTLVQTEKYIPFNKYSMTPVTISHICNDIIINGRRTIVEIGSGISTFYLYKLVKANHLDCEIISIDSDPEWINIVKSMIGLTDDKTLKFLHVPLQNSKMGLTENAVWYEDSLLENYFQVRGKKIDLLIVDGPKGSLCPFARYPGVPFFQKYLNEDYAIFLDDMGRSDEKKIVDIWKEILACEIRCNDRYAILSNAFLYDASPQT